MNPQSPSPESTIPGDQIQPSSPLSLLSPGSQRRIAIAVDLSDESAYAVRWSVQNYLRPGDSVFFLHVRPTSVLYGADWGSVDLNNNNADGGGGGEVSVEESKKKLEDEFDNFTTTKANELAKPLVEANIPFKIHIVKDHDLKERLCLEVERLGLSAVIMGSRGNGILKRISKKGRLGSVSDYCVNHCICPVVVVRYPDNEGKNEIFSNDDDGLGKSFGVGEAVVELDPVPEEEMEYHDADDELKGMVAK